MLRILFLFSLFSVFLGCNKVSDEEKATISSAPSLSILSEAAYAHSFFKEGGWPTESWWEMFQDPQLNAIIEQALRTSPTLQKAFAKVEVAESEARKERATLFPHLGANYQENWEYFSKNGFIRSFFPTLPTMPVPPTVNQIDLTLRFDYEFDFFGRNRKRFEEAMGHARAEHAKAQLAKLILTTLVTQTYIELQTKQLQQRVLQNYKQEKQALFLLASARAEHGLDPDIPPLEKEKSLYSSEQALIQIEKEIALDQHMLSFLVGVGPEEQILYQTPTAVFDSPFPLPAYLSNNLLIRRPDLCAQLWQVEAASKAIGAAQADFYPRINLMAFAGLESLAFNQLFSISSKQGGLEPALYLPLFTGGRLKSNLRAKVAAFNEAVHEYNALLLNAVKEVADHLVTLTFTHTRLQLEKNTVDTVEAQCHLQALRQQYAISDALSYLEKKALFLQEQYCLLGYRRDYLLAIVQLVKALGGGYHATQLPKEGQ